MTAADERDTAALSESLRRRELSGECRCRVNAVIADGDEGGQDEEVGSDSCKPR